MEAAAQPQHMQALAKGNRIRLARAALKRRIREGEVSVKEVLEKVPWEAETMSGLDLLSAQRRWGRGRAWKYLTRAEIPESRPLGKMTPRQRRALINVLP